MQEQDGSQTEPIKKQWEKYVYSNLLTTLIVLKGIIYYYFYYTYFSCHFFHFFNLMRQLHLRDFKSELLSQMSEMFYILFLA